MSTPCCVRLLFDIMGIMLLSQFHDCSGSSAWWRHQMETFSALLAICAGNSPVPGEFPAHKGQWRGALMFSLICVWINGWVNNREAGDLRRYHAHYDVIVMDMTLKNVGNYIHRNPLVWPNKKTKRVYFRSHTCHWSASEAFNSIWSATETERSSGWLIWHKWFYWMVVKGKVVMVTSCQHCLQMLLPTSGPTSDGKVVIVTGFPLQWK